MSIVLRFPTWHEQSLEDKKFLLEFIGQVETQIQTIIDDYVNNREEYHEEGYTLYYHKGIDSSEYDTDEFFYVYFPNLHRRSAFITLYSFFENKLVNLAKKIQADKNIEESYADISKKSIIYQAVRYVIKHTGIKSPMNTAAWKETNEIREVRNVIVHNESVIDENLSKHKKVKKYIDNSALLTTEPSFDDKISEIVIQKGFLEYALDKFYELLGEMDDAMNLPSSTKTTT